MVEELNALAQRLGWDFRDRSLLFQSLVHRSYLNENPGTHLKSNERLEFLGDAVLDAVAAEFLFQRCPEMGEGELTLWRSALVRTETLADFAAQLDLGRYLVMGRGEEADGGRTRTTILADAFEAVLGAVYLDGGLEAARTFFIPFMVEAMDKFAGQLPIDFKSALQIEVQGRIGITPQYRTAAAWGPDHARTFQVEVWAGDRLLGRGEGLSKQAAQQEAAKVALEQLQPAGTAAAQAKADSVLGALANEKSAAGPPAAAKKPQRRAAASPTGEAPRKARRRRNAPAPRKQPGGGTPASPPVETLKKKRRRTAASPPVEAPKARRGPTATALAEPLTAEPSDSPAAETPQKAPRRRTAASPAAETPQIAPRRRAAASPAAETPQIAPRRRAAASPAAETPKKTRKRRTTAAPEEQSAHGSSADRAPETPKKARRRKQAPPIGEQEGVV